jgi:nicotinamide mononucleotide transporter
VVLWIQKVKERLSITKQPPFQAFDKRLGGIKGIKTMSIMPTREQGPIINIAQSLALGILLTALSYAVGLGFGWITTAPSLLEAFAVFTSYACTYLCVMERRANYPLGAISTAAYCLLFYQFGLFASMAINGFLAVYLLYGWFRWKSDADTRPVTRMSLPSWAVSIVVAATGYAIVVLLASLAGGTLAWTDSFILAGTILAQFMLDNKKIENWYIWALVNVFAIYTYFTAGLALAGFQSIFFLANTAYGYYMWKRSEKVVTEPAQAPVVGVTV